MKRVIAALLGAALATLSQTSAAQPAAVVEGVQMPAWIERGSERRPLAVGMELKIAEVGPDSGGIFKAAMRVAEGAFRFTTDLLQKSRRREVSIRVATVTAGIRGTDLWGRSTADRQVVCLIEGAIEVAA